MLLWLMVRKKHVKSCLRSCKFIFVCAYIKNIYKLLWRIVAYCGQSRLNCMGLETLDLCHVVYVKYGIAIMR